MLGGCELTVGLWIAISSVFRVAAQDQGHQGTERVRFLALESTYPVNVSFAVSWELGSPDAQNRFYILAKPANGTDRTFCRDLGQGTACTGMIPFLGQTTLEAYSGSQDKRVFLGRSASFNVTEGATSTTEPTAPGNSTSTPSLTSSILTTSSPVSLTLSTSSMSIETRGENGTNGDTGISSPTQEIIISTLPGGTGNQSVPLSTSSVHPAASSTSAVATEGSGKDEDKNPESLSRLHLFAIIFGVLFSVTLLLILALVYICFIRPHRRERHLSKKHNHGHDFALAPFSKTSSHTDHHHPSHHETPPRYSLPLSSIFSKTQTSTEKSLLNGPPEPTPAFNALTERQMNLHDQIFQLKNLLISLEDTTSPALQAVMDRIRLLEGLVESEWAQGRSEVVPDGLEASGGQAIAL